MIISRTPFRLSFFGGGTDYPKWYLQHGGAVLGTAINKYAHISLRRLPPFFKHNHRLVYSKIELVDKYQDFEHPAVRAVLMESGLDDGLEIHYDGDLPARSGLGSSSSFTVGLLNALHAYQGRLITKDDLAREAIRVEQEVIGENVGSQDQIWAAFGGLNRIDFRADGSYEVTPLIIRKARREALMGSLMIFFTGLSRYSSNIAGKQIANLDKRVKQLKAMREMVDEAQAILQDETRSLDDFGALLQDSWRLKRELADEVSTSMINEIYEAAIEAGARGGKVLGAGGGGFMVFFARPEVQGAVRERLKDFLEVSIDFCPQGSRIVIYEPDDGI